MAETTEKIYRIKFEGTQATIESLVDLRDRINNVKDAMKALDKTTDDGKKKNEELTLILKDLDGQYRSQQKEIQNRDKQMKGEADTLEKMRARLANMYAEYEKIPVGTKAFTDQQKAVKELKDKIDSAEQSTGHFQRNVGNYKNGIIDAFQQMGIPVTQLTQGLGTAKAAMMGMTTATGTTSTAMKVLKVALASTGIGLLIVALGSLIAYFASTQAGIDKVNAVLIPLRTIFERIVGIVQQFGSGLAKIFSGEFREGFKEIGSTIGNIGNEMRAAVSEGSRMAAIVKEIGIARLKLAENEDRLKREMAEQRTIIGDQMKTEAQRIAAGEAYKKLRNELLGLEKNIASLEYEQAEVRARQNDTDREAQADIAKKREAINALEAAALNEQKEVNSVISGIMKTRNAAQLKAIEDEKKARQELYDMQMAMEKLIREQAADLNTEADKYAMDALDAMQDEEMTKYQKNVDAVKESEKQKIDIINQTYEFKKQLAEAEIQLEMAKYDAAQMGIEVLRSSFGEQSKIGKALFLFSKAISIAQIIKEAQVAKMQLLANFMMIPPILPPGIPNPAYPLAAGIYATKRTLTDVNMAMSIAAVAAQVIPTVSKFAKGGIVGGQLHEQGGTKYYGTDGQTFEAERGELITVVNRYDTERLASLSRLNSVHGKPFFASGGMLTPRTDFGGQAQMVNAMKEALNQVTQIPVVVSERDISKAQRRVYVAEKTGNL